MFAQETPVRQARQPTVARPATASELSAVTALMAEEESPVSDAPSYCPEAAGILLLALLLSPKQPKERRS
ncbi:hypothetical protein [Kitasatospora sp. NBC_01266]|uniref:hypothetical protein n=1 Tax=Kitasatospora sp. NBC_01266 TaxID=2903572 RepID=UPI002E348351|nr:hypothetical protein [Kitasatospora sp. NBC_01266]